jgi:lipoprotein-anchoring transpeptidase ErfK/SrfK
MRMTLPLSRGVLAIVAVVVVAGAGGTVAAVTQLTGSSGSSGLAATAGTPGARPSITLEGLRHGQVAWNKKLRLVADNGTIRSIRVFTKNGNPLTGTLAADASRWVSATKLIPQSRYRAQVVLANGGNSINETVKFRSTDSHRHLTALLSPGDGDVVGVGSPVIVRLSRPVPDKQRAAVENRLAVSAAPSVVGAWHWMTPQELHWRPPTYWRAHTTVTVSSNLDGLYVGHGVWGEGVHRTNFRIGDSHISRVDVARHQMYVYQNRHLIKTFPISAGRTQYPTKNGVHITFEKSQVVTMDSATVGIPRNSPDGYYEKVYWDVRISYGGAFVHAAPWSVASQGLVNVSHGCVNISTANAIWFYNYSLRGDIVDVYNSGAAPDLSDPGMADWNMSWKEWVAGDAAPTTTALVARPPLPHDSDPKAPGTHSAYVPPAAPSSPAPTSSPRQSADATPTAKPHHSGQHH